MGGRARAKPPLCASSPPPVGTGFDVRKRRVDRPDRWHNSSMPLDSDACYRALATHDPRFDGRFFVGVSSTRIYCRPVCTVRLPRRENCRFFASAAAAEVDGYRPCLRCRPELAPGNASIDAGARLAQGAVDLIENGVLDAGGIEHLSARVGVTSRHLRRIFAAEFGVSPIEYAQTQRLLLAKRLLTDTALPVTEVALASGFASVRRFNALFKARYRMRSGPPARDAECRGASSRARVRALVPPAVRLGVDAGVSRSSGDRRRGDGDARHLRAHGFDRPSGSAARRPHRSAALAAQVRAARFGVAIARARGAGRAVAGEARVRPRLRSGGGRRGAGPARRRTPRLARPRHVRRLRACSARRGGSADLGARRAHAARPHRADLRRTGERRTKAML